MDGVAVRRFWHHSTIALFGLGLAACSGPQAATDNPKPSATPLQSSVERESFELKRICADLGRQRAQQEEKRINGMGWVPGESQFCFSAALHTCIYSGAESYYSGGQIKSMSLHTVDLLTNIHLLDGMSPPAPAGVRTIDGRSFLSVSDYHEQNTQLFRNCIE